MQIIKANISNLKGLMKLYATGIEKLNNRNYNHWDEFYTEKKISNILKKQEKIIFIFKDDNVNIGTITISTIKPEFWKDNSSSIYIEGLVFKNPAKLKELFLFIKQKTIKLKFNKIRFYTYGKDEVLNRLYQTLGVKLQGTVGDFPTNYGNLYEIKI